jgi:hypothetical protein
LDKEQQAVNMKLDIVGQGSTGGNMKLDIVGQGSTGK